MTKFAPYTAIVLVNLTTFAALAQDEEAASEAIAAEPVQNASDERIEPSGNDFESPLDQTVPVADAVDLSNNEVEAAPTTEEQLLEEFARYRRLIQQGTLDEADIAAKRIVEMAIKVYGPQSRETASALNNLGIVQHSNGQFDAAIQNFKSAVEIIEVVEDRLNGALINPLKGLGAAQLGIGRPDQARKTFTRAAHITHVNEGPHNLGQIEILESIAETYIRLGDTKEARKILDRIHVINVKHYEENPMGLLPSLMSRADWQHRAGYFSDERATYRRAIRIIEDSSSKNNPMLIEPLRRLGASFYFVDLSMGTPQGQGLVSTGEMYFKRAVRLAEKADDLDWREYALTQLALADYYIFTDSQNQARKGYARVWKFLSADEQRIALRDELFREPVPIRTNVLPTYAGGGAVFSADELKTGLIRVDFSVTVRGRVHDIRTEADPEEFTGLQRMVHREIRSRAFRPRLVDGVPVQANDVVFEHEFSYAQNDLDDLREKATASDDSQ